MKKRNLRFVAIALISLALLFLLNAQAFAQAQAVDYLCELGKSFYSMGRNDDALAEFNKALLIDPSNEVAREYINKIFMKSFKFNQSVAVSQTEPVSQADINGSSGNQKLTKEQAMDMAFADYSKDSLEGSLETDAKKGPLKVSGSMQLGFGSMGNDAIWKRANYDLNERNWRVLSTAAYNRRFNTFDTRVYDSLSVNLDTRDDGNLNFHSNITVDPWSFTGKSSKFSLTGAGGDSAEIELRYWSNTRYTLNDTVYTKLNGDTFSLPEIKVNHGKIDSTRITSSYSNIFIIPETKVKQTFQPVRELWFDYLNDDAGLKLRIFPIAYQDQAYLSDDPLQITNHHVWWASSPWLKKYTRGNFNSGASPVDFTKGRWDDTYSNIRDSVGKYLTALRGFSFTLGSDESTSFATTAATPKDLWQDYEQLDNYITASRLKHKALDNLMLGATFTSRTGINLDNGSNTDSRNYVGGADLSYEIFDGLKTQAEVLTSQSYYDETNSTYKTKARGNAYYFTLINRYPQKEIITLSDTYNQIKRDKEEPYLVKTRFFLARMDDGFDSSLSEYKDTRDDTLWSRHLSFRRTFGYFSPGLSSSYIDENAVNATRIGDGIDTGRSSIGFRNEIFYENKFSNLFDVRNVHNVNGKYIETEVRDEVTIKPTEKLTVKGLLLYQDLPKTKGGIDPFDIDPDTNVGLANTTVPDGADPSIKTGSLGLEYAFEEWISANLIWERTNDYYLAYGNFPNGILNDANLSRIYYENGNRYRGWNRWLYSQGIFEQAPYPFYNIYKAGLNIIPLDRMNVYFDYTYNDFKMAGQNSDNMNHFGLQFVYEPTEKIGFSFRYTYSRWKNPVLMNAGNTKTIGHHNVFGEFRYLPSQDSEFNLQYGEGNSSAVDRLYDPTGGSLLTIDTPHIIRAYYRKKF